jgi:hypothetical protein
LIRKISRLVEDHRYMISSYSSSMSRSVLLTSPFLLLNRLDRLYDENDQIRDLSRYVLGLVNAKQQAYSIYMEESELAVPEVVVMSIRDEALSAFTSRSPTPIQTWRTRKRSVLRRSYTTAQRMTPIFSLLFTTVLRRWVPLLLLQTTTRRQSQKTV